ncbi:MAG: TetR/AcrR family transcriptional regulator [Chitinophagales bacterium]
MPRTKTFCEVSVLEKAMEFFWKNGYNATSINDLVGYMGINRQSLYDTYGDKKTLFIKAFKHYRKINKERINSFFAEQPFVKEGIKKLFLSSIQSALEDTDRKGCFVINCTTELLPNEQEFQPLILCNQQEMQQIFKDYLQLGIDRGEIAEDKNADTIAAYLFTLYGGLQVNAKVSPNKAALTNTILLGLSVLD